jgi:antitoxin (DNA-binding transcriptional repressor) of toxin-antitoxin stability system
MGPNRQSQHLQGISAFANSGNSPPKYVQRAGAGENIVISVSGEPVALLGPLHLHQYTQVSITELIAKTALIAPRRKDAFVLSEPVSVHSGARIDQLLREVRG